jgi:chromosome segregation ATPase
MLSKAETELGVLGWQQADFSAGVLEHVGELNAFERQQAELSNRSADLQLEIDALQFQLDEKRNEHAEHKLVLECELKPLAESHSQSVAALVAGRTKLQRFDKAISELQAARDLLEDELNRLMSSDQSGGFVHESIRLRDRIAANENERDDLRRSRVVAFTELKVAEENNAALDFQVSAVKEKMDAVDDELASQERKLVAHIDVLQHEKGKIEKLLKSLDRKKSPAFMAIGRCLADCNIAPLNQPDALELVLYHRAQLEAIQQRIASSLEESARAERTELLLFYASVALAILAACAFFFRRFI